MIVVGIIGVLTMTARGTYLTMTAKAKQAEAKTMLNKLRVLAESYMIEHGTYDAGVPLPGRLTRDLDTGSCGTPDYCIIPNELGFSLNCQIRRYDYFYIVGGGTYYAEARELSPQPFNCTKGSRPIFPGCDLAQLDIWRTSVDGGLIHYLNANEFCL